MQNSESKLLSVRKDLGRLAAFGANISDAHSCFIFLPRAIDAALCDYRRDTNPAMYGELVLSSYHSLSNCVIGDVSIPKGNGLIGWVAKNQQIIHMAPFDRASSAIGTYSGEQNLKSFIALPIHILGCNEIGVIACDSKKSFAFTPLQTKLLQNLTDQITRTLNLCGLVQERFIAEDSWQRFIERGIELGNALGKNSIDILRLVPSNLNEVECRIGTTQLIEVFEQVYRLIQQALPPHFPICRLPNGHIIIILDNMMTGFFENKIELLLSKFRGAKSQLTFQSRIQSISHLSGEPVSLEDMVAMTANTTNFTEYREVKNVRG